VPEAAPLVVTGATLVPAPGIGPAVGDLELRIDASGITQLGGTPVTAWQIPWVACRDVRTARLRGLVVIALSFGALRYRWEIPDDGVPGGAAVVESTLRALAGARPMVRGVRSTRRRR
jgi:hypothetical protein